VDASVASVCFHCGNPLADGALKVWVAGIERPVCCAGCEAAAGLILGQGLGRFYEFRRQPLSVAHATPRNWSIYDREAAQRRYTHEHADGEREVSLQIEDLHCAACAWLIENSLRHGPGITQIHVNPISARAELRFQPRRIALSQILGRVHALGFSARPLSFAGGPSAFTAERRTALLRLAVAGFGMMQVMTYAVSLYMGALSGIQPSLEHFLRFVSLLVATPVVLYSAQPFFASAWSSLRAARLGMDVPVALSIGAAYLWSVCCTVRGRGTVYFDSAVMFTFFLLLGRYIEMSLRHRSGLQHDALARLLPDSVLRLQGERAERVTPDELRAGERVRLLPGERVPADGVIVSGRTEVDESLLTGESAARVRSQDDDLIAGTVNLTGVIEMRVSRVGQDSTLAAVSRLLERAAASRPHIAEVADRVAAWFVGAVLLLAAGVGLYWLHADAARAFPTVLAVLVVTCPCALSLATPAALAAATTRLARSGLLVSRGEALEQLARADRALFDKTGTLTRGNPQLAEVKVCDPGISSTRCLALAAALESHSEHPLARAFAHLTPAAGLSGAHGEPGRGVEACVDGVRYRIGRRDYVLEGCASPAPLADLAADDTASSVLLGDSSRVLAVFRITDTLRADAQATLRQLQTLGLAPQIVSGDRPAAVAAIAHELGDIAASAQMTASAKLARVQGLQQSGRRVLMVGDGVNDAPVLAAADVSVAVAGGTDLAKVSADIVLLGEGLNALVGGVETSRRMLQIIRQNLAWALLYNAAAVPLAAAGWLEPWMAALGMSLSSLRVVLNALRLLKVDVRPASAAPVQAGTVLRA